MAEFSLPGKIHGGPNFDVTKAGKLKRLQDVLLFVTALFHNALAPLPAIARTCLGEPDQLCVSRVSHRII